MLSAAQNEVVNHLQQIFPNHTVNIIQKTVLHLDSLKEALDQGQLLQRGIEVLLDRSVAEQIESFIPEEPPADPAVINTEPGNVGITETEPSDVVVTGVEPADVLVTKTEGPKDLFVVEKPKKSSSVSETISSPKQILLKSLSQPNLSNPATITEGNNTDTVRESSIETTSNINRFNTQNKILSFNEIKHNAVCGPTFNKSGPVEATVLTTSNGLMPSVSNLSDTPIPVVAGPSNTSIPNELNSRCCSPYLVSSRSTTPSLSSAGASPWTDDELPDIPPPKPAVAPSQAVKCPKEIKVPRDKIISESHPPSGISANAVFSRNSAIANDELPEILPPKHQTGEFRDVLLDKGHNSSINIKETVVQSIGKKGTDILINRKNSDIHKIANNVPFTVSTTVPVMRANELLLQISSNSATATNLDHPRVARMQNLVKEKTGSQIQGRYSSPIVEKHSTPYKVDLTRRALAQRETTPNTRVTMYGSAPSSTPGKASCSTLNKPSDTVKTDTHKPGNVTSSVSENSSSKQRLVSFPSAPQLPTKNTHSDTKTTPVIQRNLTADFVSNQIQTHNNKPVIPINVNSGPYMPTHELGTPVSMNPGPYGHTHKPATPSNMNPGPYRPTKSATGTSANVPSHHRVTMYETPPKVAPNIDVQTRHVNYSLQQEQRKDQLSANKTHKTVESKKPAVTKAATVTIQSQHIITYSDSAKEPKVVIPAEQTVVVPTEQTLVLSAPEVTVETSNDQNKGGATPVNPETLAAAGADADADADIIMLEKSAADQRQEVITNVLSLFPDVEVQFLNDLAVQHSGPYAVNNICDILLESKYPTEKAAPEPTATVTAPSTSSLSSVDFYTDHTSVKIPSGEIYLYSDQTVTRLGHDFRWIPTAIIRKVVRMFNDRYAPSHKALRHIWLEFSKAHSEAQGKYSGKEIKGKVEVGGETKELKFVLLKNRRPGTSSPVTCLHPVLQQELTFVAKREEQLSREADFQVALALNEQEYEEMGQMIECGCCYGEYPFERMIQCYDGHLFCQSCLHQYAKETVFGQGKVTLTCMTDECTSTFPKSQLVIALPSSVLDKYEDRLQEESLNLADIGDLVRCPHCDFAAIMDPADKVFRCQASSCMRETCRYCKEDWREHFGKKCEEIEKKDETKLRLEYEEKMTKAKVRTCHRCKAEFTKEDGCNKMTCRCGAKMCYICRKPDINYDHFCRHPRDPGKKCKTCTDCSLWTNADEDDNRAVAEIQKAAEDARKEKGFLEEKLIGAPSEPPAKKQKTK